MKRITRYGMICALLAGVLASCDGPNDMSRATDNGRVQFQGLVKNSQLTRSDFNEKDFVLINSSSDAMFGEIGICRSVASTADTYAIYQSADGMEGRLSAISSPLIWNSNNSEHIFYAWTFPSVADASVTGGVEMDNDASTQGKVTFGIQKDTHLEQFIVAKEGPLTYEENGLYVKLLFYRPVAKIQLESLTHISANGSQTPVEKCRIEFPNLYRAARFDAKKERPESENQGNVWLQPGDTGYEEPQKGVVWNWDISDHNALLGDYVLYVHPFAFGTDEADGSQPDETQPGYFTITANIDGTEKVYFASLAGMIDIKELQAGQYMKLQVSIQDGGFGGVGCQIIDWNTEPEQSSAHHQPGIYSQEDAEALLQILQSEPLDTEALGRYCRNGNTIHLYTSIDWSSLNGPLTIPDGYTLNGQGYSIILGDGGSLNGSITNLRMPDGSPYAPTEP
ncbi:MAG TPA: fimbrillin family protein [Candidatus Alistipes intestinipullorum]|nr:fimbrillin family protein [Candidatus Alistipes intestinipullorum]